MDKEEKEKLLTEFAEYCHTRYKGCSMEDGEHVYSYDTQIVCMIEDFIESSNTK